jgi:hypothetical protein
MGKGHRRRIRPDKASRAALGEVALRGFYSRIEVTQAAWPSCSTCGRKTALVDQEHGESLRCRMERRKQAREAAPEAGGPF